MLKYEGMKIAVLSDSHDHIPNLEKALKQIKVKKVEVMFFCGDMCSPFTAGIIGKVNLPVYACFGNNDEDQIAFVQLGGKNFTWVPLFKEFGEVELNSRKIAYCHYPKLGEFLAKSEGYDAVFYGHTHKVRNEKFGKTLLLNSGSVCGIDARYVLKFEGEKQDIASYAIYDTKTNSAEIIEIK